MGTPFRKYSNKTIFRIYILKNKTTGIKRKSKRKIIQTALWRPLKQLWFSAAKLAHHSTTTRLKRLKTEHFVSIRKQLSNEEGQAFRWMHCKQAKSAYNTGWYQKLSKSFESLLSEYISTCLDKKENVVPKKNTSHKAIVEEGRRKNGKARGANKEMGRANRRII